jgi:hypothetical protein
MTRKTKAVLEFAPPIAQQVIVKSLEGGGLIVFGKFDPPNQILSIVCYWLPHVRIISPERWQEELEAGLRGVSGALIIGKSYSAISNLNDNFYMNNT